MKKYIKLFEEFEINETVYQLGLGGGGVYSSRGDSSVKAKTISLLKSGKWERTAAGKWALEDAQRLADMWNAKDPSQIPGWIKTYATDKEGKFKPSNFISTTALIVAVLDETSKRESADWVEAGGARNQCFANSAKWAKENDGKAVGGICIPKDQLDKYSVESLVVHAFCEKDRKYYEVTFPNAGIAKNQIYWPLLTFNEKADEQEISQDIWSYALGLEDGVKEYIEKYL